MYPMCLYFLDLLQYEHFRREIVNSQCCKFIDDQAILQWQHYTRKRIKMFNSVNGINQNQINVPPNTDSMSEAQQPQMGAQQSQQSQPQPVQTIGTACNIQNGSMVANTVNTQPQAQLSGPQQAQMNGNSSGSINQSNASSAPLIQKM